MKVKDISYNVWLEQIKQTIKKTQIKIALTANEQLIEMYWQLAEAIVQKQETARWGDAVLERLSVDLRLAFPNIKGFSRRNLYAIRQWYLFYSAEYKFVPQVVAQIPWGHNRLIIAKIKDRDQALFYCQATIANGWSRDSLEMAITHNYYQVKGKAVSNFEYTLPSPYSELAKDTLQNPYYFDFLGLENDALEREIEDAMMHHITQFLITLGKGFAFVGRQYQLVVSDNEYFIDLLFYHLQLRCYVVIELKAGKFKPEYAGKLNFYLSAVDSQLKHETDNPSIGLILCKYKDKVEAEYALRDIQKPIGISEYILTQALPLVYQNQLPSVEQLEQQLAMNDTPSLDDSQL